MANFIEADVIQKIATEAEWLTQTRIPYKGQIMIVSDSSGKVTNIKVGDGVNPFADLNYMFDSIQQNVNYVAVTGTALPTPVADVAFSIIGEGDYTFNGNPAFTVPTGHWGVANWSSGAWSFVDMGGLPTYQPSGGVDVSNEEAPSGQNIYNDLFDTGQKDLKAILLNKGKLYPMKNYFTDSIATVVQFRKALLDAVVYCNDADEFNYSLVQLNKGHVPSGNRVDIRKKNKITNETVATYTFRTMGSGSESLSVENRKQLDKLESGNIETVTIVANDNSFKLELTFDTSEFPSGSYNLTMSTADWQDFVFEESVYRLNPFQEIEGIKDRLPKGYVDTGVTLDRPGEAILAADGTYFSSTGGSSTNMIAIDDGKEYFVSGRMLGASSTIVAFYNADNEFIGTQYPANGSAFEIERQPVVPVAGATQFAFTTYGGTFALETFEDLPASSQQDVDSLKSRVDDLEDDVTDLDDRVTVLENSGSTNMLKAAIWEAKIQTREEMFRHEYQEALMNNPSFDAPYYGVTWNESDTNPDLVTRIGNDMSLHASLPIQSKMRRCVMKNGIVQYYLDAENSELKSDGTTPANLDGTDGDVMVEIPDFFFKWTDNGSEKTILISEWGMPDYKYSPRHYISAYECTVDRINEKLASVCTTRYTVDTKEVIIENSGRYVAADTGFSLGVHPVLEIDGYTANASQYRGVTNDDSLDGETNPANENYSRNQLGRPVSNINRKRCRQYATNGNALIQQYDSQKSLTYLIWVEFATRQIQSPFELDNGSGYKQGGLGRGAVVYPDYASYEKFFAPQGGNALLPCGTTNMLGNNSGEVYFLIKNVPVSSTGTLEDAVYTAWGDVYMPIMSYRGIENFYGHLYKIVDNIDAKITNVGGSIRRNEYYYQKNPYLCNDSDSVDSYDKIGDIEFNSSIRVIDKLLGGDDGHILPISEGGTNYQQFYCDCVEHITGWRGNTTYLHKYLTYNGRIVSTQLVGLLFSVIAVDIDSDRSRTSDTVRMQYF